jgi:hypothetical protein
VPGLLGGDEEKARRLSEAETLAKAMCAGGPLELITDLRGGRSAGTIAAVLP